MTITFKLFVVSVATTFLPFNYQNNNTKMLLGEWKVTQIEAEYPSAMSFTEQAKAKIGLDKWAEGFKSAPFIFGKDSTMSVMGKDGKWGLNKDGIHIRFLLMANEELNATILLLKPDSLKFSVMDHDTREFFTMIKVKNK